MIGDEALNDEIRRLVDEGLGGPVLSSDVEVPLFADR